MSKQRKLTKGIMALLGVGSLGLIGISADAADLNQPVAHGPSTVLFWGGNAKEKAYYLYGGGVTALSGDISQDGLLFRAVLGFGEYKYSTTAVASGKVNGDIFQAEASLGYQIYSDAFRLSGYLGIDYQDNDLSPNDTTNSTRGDEVGAKFQAEVETVHSAPYYASLMGSYSTANDSYWSRARIGYKFDGFIIGPEGLLMGNNEYDGQRIGAFLGGISLGALNVSISGGYADVDGTQGGSSGYGAIGFSMTF